MKKDVLKKIGMKREFSNWLHEIKVQDTNFMVGHLVYLKPTKWRGYDVVGIKEGDGVL